MSKSRYNKKRSRKNKRSRKTSGVYKPASSKKYIFILFLFFIIGGGRGAGPGPTRPPTTISEGESYVTAVCVWKFGSREVSLAV